jgi:hypothetical protein
MKFVIGMEPGTRKSAWGMVVPDLPGVLLRRRQHR